jgi:hypothetical protein
MSGTALILIVLGVLYFSLGIFGALSKEYWTTKQKILYIFIWPFVGL